MAIRIIDLGVCLLSMAAGCFIGNWLCELHNDKPEFLVFMGAQCILFGLAIHAAKYLYRRLA